MSQQGLDLLPVCHKKVLATCIAQDRDDTAGPKAIGIGLDRRPRPGLTRQVVKRPPICGKPVTVDRQAQ